MTPSDERLAEIILHGEIYVRFSQAGSAHGRHANDDVNDVMDEESRDILNALRQLQALRATVTTFLRKHDTAPDGTYGAGITNGDFFALRDALDGQKETPR